MVSFLRILLISFFLPSCGRYSQGTEKNVTGNVAGIVTTFIPAGFELMDSLSGNLNSDSLTDLLLICRPIGEDTLSIAEDSLLKRIMLILKGNSGDQYVVAAQSENAVYCFSCGGMYGDPYAGLEIVNQSFSISHYGGATERWTRNLTFNYEPNSNDWLLVKDGSEVFDAHNTDSVELEVKTPSDFGKITFSYFNIYN